VLTPNELIDLPEADRRLMQFQGRCARIAQPIEGDFSRADLALLMARGNGPHAAA
jgi:hypothetical protein